MDGEVQQSSQGPPPGVILGDPVPAPASSSSSPSGPPPGVVLGDATAAATAPPPGPLAAPPADASQTQPPKSVWQRVKDAFNDDPQVNLAEGFGKGAMKTMGGLLDLGQKTLGFGVADAKPTGGEDYVQDAANWLKNHANPEGVFQQLGNAGENIAELLGTSGVGELAEAGKVGEAAEAAPKVLSVADKLKQSQQIASFLEAHPKIAKLTALGLHTAKSAFEGAMQAGTQTAVKTGGDPEATGTAAAEGGVLGGLLGGGMKALSLAREAYASTTGAAQKALSDYQQAMQNYRQQVADRLKQTDVQNSTWQAAKQQQAAEFSDAMKAHRQALLDHASNLQDARAKWKAEIDAQGKAHQAALDDYNNQVSTVTDANKQSRAAWKAQIDAQGHKYMEDLAEFQKQHAEHIQAVKSLTNEATTALKTSRQTDAQANITNIARGSAEGAIARFNRAMEGSKNFEPAELNEPDGGLKHFGDSADAVREAARPVYDAINEATEGKFNELQRARSTAMRANNPNEVEKVEGKIDQMLTQNPGVTPQEWRAAKSAWSDSKDLDRIHNAVEGSFNGISEDMAAKAGTGQRLLRGSALQTKLGNLFMGAKPMSDARVSELVGKDGLEGLYRAAHLTSTPELRSATKQVAENVAAQLQPPTPPVKPEIPPKPELQPKPTPPTRPTAPPRPETPPKPPAPVRPVPPEKPEPLPRPTLPTKPTNLPKKPGFSTAVGAHMTEAVVGSAIAHATGIPYAYAIGGTAATRFVLRQMIVNPEVGRLMEYAVKNNVSPKVYGPVIGGLITAANQRAQGGQQ